MKSIKLLCLLIFISTINISFAQANKVDSLSVEHIINKYISSVGGSDNLLNVKDITTEMQGSVSGVDVKMTVYQKSPNKILKEINAGAVRQIILYDGTNAFMKIGKSQRKLSNQALEGLKYESMTIFMLSLDELKIKTELLANENIEGRNIYKVKLILPSGEEWIYFFDVESGLKIKSLKTVYSPQGAFTQTTFFSDYNSINGINFPFNIKQTIGIQSLEFKVNSIKINTGLKDEIFKTE